MNIEEHKKRILKNIELLETDIEILQENICELKEAMPNITTKEDAEKFDSTFDIEKGLKIISIF